MIRMSTGSPIDRESLDGGFALRTIRSRRQTSSWYWGAIAILLAILVSSTPWTNAQIATTTATLSGVVSDPSGALLPKASVNLASVEKGVSRNFVSDDGGRYTFNQLPPGTYILTIKAKGFEAYEQSGIVLNAAETATQNVTLTMGGGYVAPNVGTFDDSGNLNWTSPQPASSVIPLTVSDQLTIVKILP